MERGALGVRRSFRQNTHERQDRRGRRRKSWCLAALCLAALWLATAGVACSRSRPAPEADVAPVRATARAALTQADNAASEASGSDATPALRGGLPCGEGVEPRCLHFPSAAAALRALLESKPQVVAFGEAHARRDAARVLTATERFERELLPVLAQSGAHQMVVELLLPATNCEKAVRAVEQVQKPVVQAQDAQNQDRFVSLGHAAKALGVTPFLLEPTCEEFQAIQGAGEDGVVRMLELIASKTTRVLLKMKQVQSEPQLLVAYGGAMHNDVGADPATKPFTFGDEMVEATKGRYLAIDLIVPEYIAPTPVWQKLPWYEAYQQLGASDQVTLFQVDQHSVTLIFARGASPHAKPESSR